VRVFSYRNKMRLRSLLITLLIVLAVLAVVAIGVFVYLQRYVVYTPQGARLDFSPRASSAGKTSDASPLNPEFVIESESESQSGETAAASAPLSGWYVTGDMLADTSAVSDALAPTGSRISVLMDVKSGFGNFYYPSAVSGVQTSTAVDTTAVSSLIAELSGRTDLYRIARVSAFRDSNFALANQDCGLPLSSGALWMDSDGCYWLDPANDKVISYLESIAAELKDLGFDEVVFSDFSFPEGAGIVYSGDKTAVLAEAARRLSANLKDSGLAVSFSPADAALAPYAARLYEAAADGSGVQALVSGLKSSLTDPASQLVFLTDSRDTRFNSYGVLRPAVTQAAKAAS